MVQIIIYIPISPSPRMFLGWLVAVKSLWSSAPFSSIIFPLKSPLSDRGFPTTLMTGWSSLKYWKPGWNPSTALGTWMISSTRCSRGCFRTLGTSTTFSTIWTSGISWMISCQGLFLGGPFSPVFSWGKTYEMNKLVWREQPLGFFLWDDQSYYWSISLKTTEGSLRANKQVWPRMMSYLESLWCWFYLGFPVLTVTSLIITISWGRCP